jgi:pantoate--beta-alanine ligase
MTTETLTSVSTIAELRARVAEFRAKGERVRFFPTMGALHGGHLEVVRRAHETGDRVVVSIFVNPLQFGPSEDLDRYPRTLDADLASLDGIADVVFVPSAAEMYPDGDSATRVTAGELGDRYEGASRPGHFDGVLTVVAKLFNIVQPDEALFAQKDAQQAFLISRMARELNLPLRVNVVPTVREPDGLALSSRNRYLNDVERHTAPVLHKALVTAKGVAADGLKDALALANDVLASRPDVKLDYLVAVDPSTFLEVGDGFRGEALLLIAARVGTTRLIDNESISLR